MAPTRFVAAVRRLLVRGLPPARAAAVGGAAVGVLALVLGVLGGSIGPAAQALLLVVPVMVTAALGGRGPAWFVAALATVTFVLVRPPVGSVRLNFADDVVALVVFAVVAFTVGGLVAHRVDGLGPNRAATGRAAPLGLARSPYAPGTISAAVSELEDAPTVQRRTTTGPTQDAPAHR